jgi:hypothetical protein
LAKQNSLSSSDPENFHQQTFVWAKPFFGKLRPFKDLLMQFAPKARVLRHDGTKKKGRVSRQRNHSPHVKPEPQ